ncbi:MAG: hypothetical protein RR949_01935 [Oscillospiraceae bacterium]
MGLSINLHTGMDYLMELPVEQLNEIAARVGEIAAEVKGNGEK